MRTALKPEQLSREELSVFTSPTWTRDGEFIVVSREKPFTSHAPFELWLYDRKGGSGIRIATGQTEPSCSDNCEQTLGVDISRDGRYLYYSHKRGIHGGGMVVPGWQIARKDRISGEEQTITQEVGGAIRPAISPDGTRLIYGTRFISSTGLRLREVKTGLTRWLKYPIDRDEQESSNESRDLLPGYTFTPDGRSIIVAYRGKIHRLNTENGKDKLIPFAVKVSQELGPSLEFPIRVETGPVRARLIEHPAISPDGTRIAFTAFAHLHVMNLPNGVPERVTSVGDWEFAPAWSADGKWLAYVTWTKQGGALWKVRSDGKAPPQRLTQLAGYYTAPVWVKDSSRVFLLRAPYQDRADLDLDVAPFFSIPNQELIWISAEGGDEHVVCSAIGAGSPHLLRDEERIYYTASDTLTADLVSVRLDGTGKRVELRVVGKNIWERELTASLRFPPRPDGRMALVLFRHQLYVVTVPPAMGGQTPTVDFSSPLSVAVSKLTDVGADYAGWSDDGTGITWSLGATVFRQAMAAVSFGAGSTEMGTVPSLQGNLRIGSISRTTRLPCRTARLILKSRTCPCKRFL